MSEALLVSAAVEGIVDDAVVRRLLDNAGAEPDVVYIVGGKANLRQRTRAYNLAAQHRPWLLLVDLNHEADCAPALRALWLPRPSPFMVFRVAVREVESWLLADRQSMAEFLGVPITKVPQAPDQVDDPKRVVVDLARRSTKRHIREDMVPRQGSGRSEGPAYATRMIEFTQRCWRPSVAAGRSESLHRCQEALGRIVASHPTQSPRPIE